MGTIRNRLTIVHDFDLDRITEMRKDAVRYFEKIVEDDSYMEYDVDSQMVSPILKSVVNQEVFENFERMEQTAVAVAQENKLGKKGDYLIITAGYPIGQKGMTNLIHTVQI